jgi:hypothetical protein
MADTEVQVKGHQIISLSTLTKYHLSSKNKDIIAQALQKTDFIYILCY